MLKSANSLHKWGLDDSDMNSTVGLSSVFNFAQFFQKLKHLNMPVQPQNNVISASLQPAQGISENSVSISQPKVGETK